jgi:hypothetical protein
MAVCRVWDLDPPQPCECERCGSEAEDARAEQEALMEQRPRLEGGAGQRRWTVFEETGER